MTRAACEKSGPDSPVEGALRYSSPPANEPSRTIEALERPTVSDRAIAAALAQLSNIDDDYWTFRRGAARRQAHGLTQYPAMMVPPMQAALLGVVTNVDRSLTSAIDPFCGAGTTLVECMRLGVSYAGQDTNPLAVLFCRVKAGPYQMHRLTGAAEDLLARAARDRGLAIEASFPGLAKWFTRSVTIALSRLRRAIRREPNHWCRRVFWTALAETVRLCSNSRTSTFKLHIRSPDDLRARSVDAFLMFTDVLSQMIARLGEEATALRQAGRLSASGCYRGDVLIRLGDSTSQVPTLGSTRHDLLITSPPYGDNTSTVPYGQYSFLPLQWIDLHDIDDRAGPDSLTSTRAIDGRSLGGHRKGLFRGIDDLLSRAPSLARTLSRLASQPTDRRSRVSAFCRDLDASLEPLLASLRPNAYMIWTVGNRRVGGRLIPTDAILSELLQSRGVRSVATIQRRIPSKRMATRNNIAPTMRHESILVFRKQ